MKALLIIDMQMLMQHRLTAGWSSVNPDAPDRIATLAETFRQRGLPVLHVRHRDDDPASPLHIDAAGFPPMPCAEALPGEPIFEKTTSSAFASTDLATWLKDHDITDLVVTGAVAGFCVNSTVRAGADLGVNMTVASDAVLGFDLAPDGPSAQTIFDVTMALLDGEFATLAKTSDLIG